MAALGEFRIEGPATTIRFHEHLLADERFIQNMTDTKWVEREYLAGLESCDIRHLR